MVAMGRRGNALLIDGKLSDGRAGTFPTVNRPERRCWESPRVPRHGPRHRKLRGGRSADWSQYRTSGAVFATATQCTAARRRATRTDDLRGGRATDAHSWKAGEGSIVCGGRGRVLPVTGRPRRVAVEATGAPSHGRGPSVSSAPSLSASWMAPSLVTPSFEPAPDTPWWQRSGNHRRARLPPGVVNIVTSSSHFGALLTQDLGWTPFRSPVLLTGVP